MQNCIDSARRSGVFADFNVLAKESLKGCESFDLVEFQAEEGLFPVFYLKLAMDRLNYDYFIWLDADSLFYSAPNDLLLPIDDAPIHVPFVHELGSGCRDQVAKRYHEARLSKPFFSCATAFWIVHHDAIELVYDLARNYWQLARSKDLLPNLSEVLGYVAHLLIADYRPHLQSSFPKLWSQVEASSPCLQSGPECDSLSQSSIVHLNSGHGLGEPPAVSL